MATTNWIRNPPLSTSTRCLDAIPLRGTTLSPAMVSLDDAVLARLERGGSRYEILVDPVLVDTWKEDPDSVPLSDLLAVDGVKRAPETVYRKVSAVRSAVLATEAVPE